MYLGEQLLLRDGQLRLSAPQAAFRLRELHPLAGASADEVGLELGDDRQRDKRRSPRQRIDAPSRNQGEMGSWTTFLPLRSRVSEVEEVTEP
jgi:hypothetical protein